MIDETRVAEAKPGYGADGTAAVRVARRADVVVRGAVAALVCSDTSLAADRVVRVEQDTVKQLSDYMSLPQLHRFWSCDEKNGSEGRLHTPYLHYRIANHGNMSGSV